MSATIVLIRLAVLAVIFVNGWTDAPNAIATAVGSGVLTFRRATALATACNFVGAALACLILPSVSDTVSQLVYFSDEQSTLTALCSAMLAVVLWAVAAWRFGIPTSESHALMAGLAGAALALGGSSAQLNGTTWTLVLAATVLCLPTGMLAGWFSRKWLSKRTLNAAAWQRRAAAAMALLHGAQDGQKFLALLLMTDRLDGSPPTPFVLLLILVASIMSLGTALGGKPIVDRVGFELASLTASDGLAADLGAGLVLAACSLCGLPVSTSHVKVAAICGAGRHVSLRAAGPIAAAWLFTFPGCALLTFGLARLLL